jgi:SMI1 / KNR4 family (SUKH-1)
MAYPGTEKSIAAAEETLGRKFSEQHRQRLLQENGGEVRALREHWTLYPVWDPTNRKTMGRTANHIIRENQGLRRDQPDIWPDGFVAIADNGGGDYLVLAPGDEVVRFWDHETGELTPVDVRWK